MSYDPKCWRLALEFLPLESTDDEIDHLAQVIQDAIEDELKSMGKEIS